MDQPSNELEHAANRVEMGDADMKPETSHYRIPSNDSGIEFDLQVQSRNLKFWTYIEQWVCNRF